MIAASRKGDDETLDRLEERLMVAIPPEEREMLVDALLQVDFAQGDSNAAFIASALGTSAPRSTDEDWKLLLRLWNMETSDAIDLLTSPVGSNASAEFPPSLVMDFLRRLDWAARRNDLVFAVEGQDAARLREFVDQARPSRNAIGMFTSMMAHLDLLLYVKGHERVEMLLDYALLPHGGDSFLKWRAENAADALLEVQDREPLTRDDTARLKDYWRAHPDVDTRTDAGRVSERVFTALAVAIPPAENSFFVEVARSVDMPESARRAAVRRLRVFDLGEKDVLLQILRSDPSDAVRAGVGSFLMASLNPDEDVSEFDLLRVELSANSSSSVRSALVHYYQDVLWGWPERDPTYRPDLERIAQSDPDASVRAEAVKALEEIDQVRRDVEERQRRAMERPR
ncbi:MAG: hypothetical protein HYY93_13010 [Planctomycetes bacterium]|nr:hypothetical protein [Planctomycetota bacterium]